MDPNGRRLPAGVTRAELEAVLEPLERARPLPARCYLGAEIFAYERATILDRAWICAGREEELALPGQWIRASVGAESLIVTRGADLEIHAMYNVCRHRAAPLVAAPCGRAERLECPYHGWAYELDGRLRAAPGAAASVDRRVLALRRVRTATWKGFVFVAIGATAPAFDRWLGAPPPWLATAPLESLRRAYRAEYDVLANWKLLVANFQESHHFTRIHPGLERRTPTARACSWLGAGEGAGVWLGGVMDLAEGAETVSISGRRGGRPLLVPDAEATRVHDAMLFPLMLTSLQPDYLLTYRLSPLAPGSTRVTFDVHFHASVVRPGFDPADVTDFWSQVNAEDRAICEAQQVGVASDGWEPICYAAGEEDGVHAFETKVARAYLGYPAYLDGATS